MRRFGYLLITYYCVKRHTSQWAFKQINASTNDVLLSVFSFSIFMRTNHRSNDNFMCVCVRCRGIKSKKWKLHTTNFRYVILWIDGWQYKTIHCHCPYLFRSIYVHAHSIKWKFPCRASHSRSPPLHASMSTHEYTHTHIQCDQVRTTMNEIIVRHQRQTGLEVRHFGGGRGRVRTRAKMPNKVPNLNFKANLYR